MAEMVSCRKFGRNDRFFACGTIFATALQCSILCAHVHTHAALFKLHIHCSQVLRNNQINRLLASIVASMVVLTAVANVEVRLPEHEIEELNSQLRYDCNALMNDRVGQDA